jgi:hypothetical protein
VYRPELTAAPVIGWTYLSDVRAARFLNRWTP